MTTPAAPESQLLALPPRQFTVWLWWERRLPGPAFLEEVRAAGAGAIRGSFALASYAVEIVDRAIERR